MTYPVFNKEIWTHGEWVCVLLQLAPSQPYELQLHRNGELVRTENTPLRSYIALAESWQREILKSAAGVLKNGDGTP
jgi:hypothetical protein